MKRLLAILLAACMIAGMTGCSSGGVPGAKADENAACACGGDSCGTGAVDSCCDGTEAGMAAGSMSEAPIEPVVDKLGPEDYAYLVPEMADLSLMLDAKATETMGHLDYQTLYAAWGMPDLHNQEKDDASMSVKTVKDQWMYLDRNLERGLTYIDVYYDLKSGQVSEVCMRGVNGHVTGDILSFIEDDVWVAGAEPRYWPDLDADDMESWTMAQAVAGDLDSIMARFQSAGLTRNTIRELYGDACGAYSDLYRNYLGDVYWLYSDETGESGYLRVEYDNIMHTIPTAIAFYADEDADGEWLDAPELESEYVYASGVYNSIKYAPVWPWEENPDVNM